MSLCMMWLLIHAQLLCNCFACLLMLKAGCGHRVCFALRDLCCTVFCCKLILSSYVRLSALRWFTAALDQDSERGRGFRRGQEERRRGREGSGGSRRVASGRSFIHFSHLTRWIKDLFQPHQRCWLLEQWRALFCSLEFEWRVFNDELTRKLIQSIWKIGDFLSWHFVLVKHQICHLSLSWSSCINVWRVASIKLNHEILTVKVGRLWAERGSGPADLTQLDAALHRVWHRHCNGVGTLLTANQQ